MLRRFLLPLLGLALFATEAASAQTTPATGAYNRPVARTKVLSAREKRAAEAAAKAEALAAAKQAAAQPTASAGTSWNGWSDEPLPVNTGAPRRPTMNVSVAPGMPLNQIGHGVTTDYNGRPLYREASSTTLSTSR